VYRDQLRGDPGDVARERNIRSRERRVHRRRRPPPGLLRACGSRDVVPRRNWRDDAGHAGEAAARAAGAEVPPAWWTERAIGRCQNDRGDERRPAGGGEAREAAGRSVLPAERVLVPPAAVARAQ